MLIFGKIFFILNTLVIKGENNVDSFGYGANAFSKLFARHERELKIINQMSPMLDAVLAVTKSNAYLDTVKQQEHLVKLSRR